MRQEQEESEGREKDSDKKKNKKKHKKEHKKEKKKKKRGNKDLPIADEAPDDEELDELVEESFHTAKDFEEE